MNLILSHFSIADLVAITVLTAKEQNHIALTVMIQMHLLTVLPLNVNVNQVIMYLKLIQNCNVKNVKTLAKNAQDQIIITVLLAMIMQHYKMVFVFVMTVGISIQQQKDAKNVTLIAKLAIAAPQNVLLALNMQIFHQTILVYAKVDTLIFQMTMSSDVMHAMLHAKPVILIQTNVQAANLMHLFKTTILANVGKDSIKIILVENASLVVPLVSTVINQMQVINALNVIQMLT